MTDSDIEPPKTDPVIDGSVFATHFFTITKIFIILFSSVIISIAILGTGIWLSFASSDWTIFSRSGSLLVIVALIMALTDHSGWLRKIIKIGDNSLSEKAKEEFKRAFSKNIEEDLKRFEIVKSKNEIDYLTDVKVQDYLQNFPNRIGIEIRKSIQKYELSIAIIGTLVWGFGDIIVG